MVDKRDQEARGLDLPIQTAYGHAMKHTLVDTFATILFFTLAASFTELVIAGLSVEQVLVTRLIMIPVMVMTGRPYGIYRDRWMASLKPRSSFAKAVTDSLAFLTFQVPVYVATLIFAGARLSEILAAVGSALFFMLIVSRPFGVFLDFVRARAGAPSQQM